MERTDPRRRYDDLVVRRERHEVGAERFDELRDAAVFRSGRGVAGVVLDGEVRSTSGSRTQSDGGERLLAIRNEAYPTEWTLPGGAVEPDESVVGESDTGGRGDGRCVEMGFVHFLCRATDPTVADGDDLGDPDEEITEAAWVESLPADVFNPDHTREVYEAALALGKE